MRRAFAVLAVIVVVLVAFVAFTRRDVDVPFGEEMQLDDMAFNLVSYRTSPTLLGGVAPTNGVFHVVGVRAVNLAKRVDHRTGAIEPHLIGGDGRRYEVSEAGQGALDAGRNARGWGDTLLHIGDAVEAEWVFDAPATLGDARIQIIAPRAALPGLVVDLAIGKRRLLLPTSALGPSK